MNIAKIAYVFPALLFMLGGCKEKSVASVSEFSARIHALDPYVIDAKRCSLVDSAIAAYPEEASFYLERSICKLHLSNDTGEIADLNKAIQLAKEKDCDTYLRALSNRGFSWMHQGKHLAAFDDFWAGAASSQECQPNPNQLNSHYWNSGLVARWLLRFDLVDSVIQNWEAIDSASMGLKYLQGEAYRLKAMPQEAVAAYNVVLLDSHERKGYDIWISRAKALKSLGKDLEARQDLAAAKVLVDKLIQRTQDSLAFSSALAEILVLQGDYASAVQICGRFMQDGDPLLRSILLCTRGEALHATGQLDQACDNWTQSVALGWGEARKRLEQYCNR